MDRFTGPLEDGVRVLEKHGFPRPDLACGVNVNDSSNEKRVSLSAPLFQVGACRVRSPLGEDRVGPALGQDQGTGSCSCYPPCPLLITWGSQGLPRCPGLVFMTEMVFLKTQTR